MFHIKDSKRLIISIAAKRYKQTRKNLSKNHNDNASSKKLRQGKFVLELISEIIFMSAAFAEVLI